MKTFNTEFDIYFEDISPCGKVHLERIAEWSSTTRERYFKSTCPDHLKFVESPVKMFTTNLAISIPNKHSKWADRISAILTTADIKKISFEMHIDFQNSRTKEIIAQTIQKVAFVNVETKKFAGVPDDMKSVIVNYFKEA
jgi:acyl-CoA thioesterase FadM